MATRAGKRTNERGQATWSAAVNAVVLILAGLLVYRVAWTAESINQKAGRIAQSAAPINKATDAALNLGTTNSLASSILESAKPLDAKLTEIVRLARSVDETARSINSSAAVVDGTAKGINTSAAQILDVARRIDRGVAQINTNLDVTIDIATKIRNDTTNILAQAGIAHHEAACISGGLPGGGVRDGHC